MAATRAVRRNGAACVRRFVDFVARGAARRDTHFLTGDDNLGTTSGNFGAGALGSDHCMVLRKSELRDGAQIRDGRARKVLAPLLPR